MRALHPSGGGRIYFLVGSSCRSPRCPVAQVPCHDCPSCTQAKDGFVVRLGKIASTLLAALDARRRITDGQRSPIPPLRLLGNRPIVVLGSRRSDSLCDSRELDSRLGISGPQSVNFDVYDFFAIQMPLAVVITYAIWLLIIIKIGPAGPRFDADGGAPTSRRFRRPTQETGPRRGKNRPTSDSDRPDCRRDFHPARSAGTTLHTRHTGRHHGDAAPSLIRASDRLKPYQHLSAVPAFQFPFPRSW